MRRFLSRFVVIAALLAAATARASAVSGPAPGPAAFEHFKQLAGTWSVKSTRSTANRLTFQLIASGSAVMENSSGGPADQAMATMFHLDGDRLFLTHYCIAKNQPRLVATGFSNNGRTVTFTFLDGTNIAARDTGHMDKVVYTFIDADHFTSQWTWYAQGKEQWMEEETATRVKDR